MKYAIVLGLFSLLGLFFFAPKELGQNNPDHEDWVSLFNGKDLSAWDIKIADRPLNDNYLNTFQVEDGMLRIVYDEYENFDDKYGHMYFKKPFITVGCKGLYQELHKLDFKTFERFWDISFNDKDTLKERVQGFFQTVQFIREKSDADFEKMMESLKGEVLHNHKNITTGKFRRISNNNFFEEVVNACS